MNPEGCRFCDGDPTEDLIAAREMMLGLRHPFTYRRCAVCGSLWLQDPPDDLGAYYGDGYYSMAEDPKGADPIPGAAAWARILLHLPSGVVSRVAGTRGFPRYLRWLTGLNVSLDSRIADVGSGEASFISQMSRHGFTDLWAYDPFIAGDKDAGSAHYRRATIGEAFGPFDLIMFHHSLEHTANPLQELHDAAQKLAPSGAILVRIPIACSYAERRYGASWVGLDPPRHLAIPSRLGMESAATRTGLVIRRVFFDSHLLQFWGSENYQRGIPLRAQPPCNPETTRLFNRQAEDLNRREDGDTAGFVLVAGR